MVTKRTLVKVVQIKKATNSESLCVPTDAAPTTAKRSNKDETTAISISDSPLLASKRVRRIETTTEHAQAIMSDILN